MTKYYKIIISLILIGYAATFNASMDQLKHHYNNSFAKKWEWNEQYWNPALSWRNKYIDQDPEKGRIKINILFFRIQKPVFFTDGWHLLKALMLLSFFLIPVIMMPGKWYKKAAHFLVITLLWSLIFEKIYNHKWRNQNKE